MLEGLCVISVVMSLKAYVMHFIQREGGAQHPEPERPGTRGRLQTGRGRARHLGEGGRGGSEEAGIRGRWEPRTSGRGETRRRAGPGAAESASRCPALAAAGPAPRRLPRAPPRPRTSLALAPWRAPPPGPRLLQEFTWTPLQHPAPLSCTPHSPRQPPLRTGTASRHRLNPKVLHLHRRLILKRGRNKPRSSQLPAHSRFAVRLRPNGVWGLSAN